MPSLRELADCLGLGGDFSVLRDFYGFFRGVLPPDPTGAQVSVSLKRELTRLQGQSFHLNVIAVGVENFTDAEDIEIDYSIYRIRNIYNQVSVGVGRVEHYAISIADANGLDSPTTKGQLEDLTNAWSVPNNGIDLFIPFNMNIPSNGGMLLGRSAVDGPCGDKQAKGMSGSVSGLWGSEQTSRTVSHEVGHYLTLNHRNDEPDNLMCQSGKANSIRDSVELDDGQGDDVKGHCFCNDHC
jgi:hypothetical protein